ncbi:MAG: Rsd/AlgQ family anti-sigma factor [bacterium]
MENNSLEDIDKYRNAIHALLEERGDVLVSYCEIIALGEDQLASLPQYLKKFSQLLVDYSALGHFEVLEPLLEGRGGKVDGRLGKEIRETTEYLLRFSDEYAPAEGGGEHNLGELSVELETLGKRLAERFEMEDRLISRTALAPA